MIYTRLWHTQQNLVQNSLKIRSRVSRHKFKREKLKTTEVLKPLKLRVFASGFFSKNCRPWPSVSPVYLFQIIQNSQFGEGFSFKGENVQNTNIDIITFYCRQNVHRLCSERVPWPVFIEPLTSIIYPQLSEYWLPSQVMSLVA